MQYQRRNVWLWVSLIDELIPSFEVVVTVRTEDKGRTIVKTLKDPSHPCSFVVVKDIAKEGAYNEVSPLLSQLRPWGTR